MKFIDDRHSLAPGELTAEAVTRPSLHDFQPSPGPGAGARLQSRSGPETVHGGAKKETKARDYKDGVERFRHVTTKGRSLTPTLFNISYLYRKA